MEWRHLSPEGAEEALHLWGRSKYPHKNYRITIIPTTDGDRWELVRGTLGDFTGLYARTYQELRVEILRLGIGGRVTNLEQAKWLYVSRDETGVRDVVDGLYAAAVQFATVYSQAFFKWRRKGLPSEVSNTA